MRISDVLRLRWSDLQDNRLHYAMGKNNKAGSLKIPDKAFNIIKRYEHLKRNKDDLIFPELKECDFSDKFKTQRAIAFKTSAIDKCLRQDVAAKADIEKKTDNAYRPSQFRANCNGDRCAHLTKAFQAYET